VNGNNYKIVSSQLVREVATGNQFLLLVKQYDNDVIKTVALWGDGTQSTPPVWEPIIGSDVIIYYSDGVTSVTRIGSGGYFVISKHHIYESDGSTDISGSPAEFDVDTTLQGVVVTDSDGNHQLEDGDTYTALKTYSMIVHFEAGNDTVTAIIARNITLTTETTDGASTFTYALNGGGAAAFVNPTSYVATDSVVIVRSDTSAAENLTLGGTYA